MLAFEPIVYKITHMLMRKTREMYSMHLYTMIVKHKGCTVAQLIDLQLTLLHDSFM